MAAKMADDSAWHWDFLRAVEKGDQKAVRLAACLAVYWDALKAECWVDLMVA
jgi:hypothetical protein